MKVNNMKEHVEKCKQSNGLINVKKEYKRSAIGKKH